MVKVHKKPASGGQGMIPWTPGSERPLPSFLRVRAFAKVFKKSYDLFINLFKRLAPGRAAGGIFNLAASGGKGGEATLGKNTLKAGCPCAFSLPVSVTAKIL